MGLNNGNKSVTFSHTQVVEFYCDSIVSFDFKKILTVPIECVDRNILDAELIARGLDPNDEDSLQHFIQLIKNDLLYQLQIWGLFNLKETNCSLRLLKLIDLASEIGRRVHLRICLPLGTILPSDMTFDQLVSELQSRRIVIANKDVKVLISDLETAMLNQAEGYLTGGAGYDRNLMGKRLTCVNDVAKFVQYMDQEVMLRIIESFRVSPKHTLEEIFADIELLSIDEIIADLKRRKIARPRRNTKGALLKMQTLLKEAIFEAELKELVQRTLEKNIQEQTYRIFREELIRELNRHINNEDHLSDNYKPAAELDLESIDTNTLFETLFNIQRNTNDEKSNQRLSILI